MDKNYSCCLLCSETDLMYLKPLKMMSKVGLFYDFVFFFFFFLHLNDLSPVKSINPFVAFTALCCIHGTASELRARFSASKN